MLAFEFATWVLFGSIIAGFAIWFMKRRDHTKIIMLAAIGASVFGGIFGRLFDSAPVYISTYSLASLICALAAATGAVYFLWHMRFRHRPGETH